MILLDQRIEDAETHLIWAQHNIRIAELAVETAKRERALAAELVAALTELRTVMRASRPED